MASDERIPDHEPGRMVDQAARSFDGELHTRHYRDVHSDARQLDWMVSAVCKAGPDRVLDVGTGNGYVALALATQSAGIHVTGVDVAVHAIERNRDEAAALGLVNVAYRVTDGIALPFPDECFDVVTSRYAFHHFPRPDITLSEIGRVLRPGGRFVLSDAVRAGGDHVDFINAFQKLKPDGHVEMLRSDALVDCVRRRGFVLERTLSTVLAFDRASNEDYQALIDSTPPEVLHAYRLHLKDGRIGLTLPIVTAVFDKCERE